MTKLEQANLVRFASEMGFFFTSVILSSILLSVKGDDDDDKKSEIFIANAAYQALRLKSELSFFYDPISTMQILRSPMASMSVFENIIKLTGQLIYPITSGTFEFARYQNGSWKDLLQVYFQYFLNNIIE